MNPRIQPLADDQASAASRTILQQTKSAVGMVPNLHRTLAHSPSSLRAYFETVKSLAGGQLAAPLREQLAVATAGINGCAYCASAHTALGKGAGLDGAELAKNLGGTASDPKAAAAIAFARELIETRGAVSDERVTAVRAAGFSDAELVEIVAHVGMNSFTNLFNVFNRTAIDFPEVELAAAR